MTWTRRIAKGAVASAPSWLAPVLLGLLMLGLHYSGLHGALVLDRGRIASVEVWRLISAHLAHWSDWHLAMNLAGLAILPLLCETRWSVRRWLLALIVLSLSVSAGILVMAPEIARYAGFSGVLHGLFLLGLVPAARAGDRIALACLLYLVGKILVESISGPLFADPDRVGAAIAQEAHLAGAVGAVALLIGEAWTRRSRRV